MKLKDLLEKYKECEVKEGFLDYLKKTYANSKTVWDLEQGDEFFYIWDTEVSSGIWNGTEEDIVCRKIDNVFLTEEDADKELKRREVEVELKKMAKGYEFILGEDNWTLVYDRLNNFVGVTPTKYKKFAHAIYFETALDALDAIDSLGQRRLIRDYFQEEW